MDFIANSPTLFFGLCGLLVGVLLMRLLTNRDKTTITKLSTNLAVTEEKLKQLQNKENEFNQLQQLYVETKTQNAELQTRMHEQGKNAEEKLNLLKDAEMRLNNQFENLAGKIFDERNKQFTEHNQTSLDHIVKPLREQLGEFKQRIELCASILGLLAFESSCAHNLHPICVVHLNNGFSSLAIWCGKDCFHNVFKPGIVSSTSAHHSRMFSCVKTSVGFLYRSQVHPNIVTHKQSI